VSVNIFRTRTLRDRWAEVDETWHVLFSTGLETKRLGSGRNFEYPALSGATPNLARLEEMTHPERAAYVLLFVTVFTLAGKERCHSHEP